jgi:hypothetical protein
MLKLKYCCDVLGRYQFGAFANSRGKCTEDLSGHVEPPLRPSIATPGLNKLLDLISFLKNGEYGTGRVAGLEVGGQLMREKVILCLLFVPKQSSIENGLEIGRGCRGSGEGGLGHRG